MYELEYQRLHITHTHPIVRVSIAKAPRPRPNLGTLSTGVVLPSKRIKPTTAWIPHNISLSNIVKVYLGTRSNTLLGIVAVVSFSSFSVVQQSMPASEPSSPPMPFAISLEATELIQIDGAPRLSVIEKTGIRYVSNTESDLFNYENQWYFLLRLH